MVGHGDARRLLAGGGGLCSPGQWQPHLRLEPKGVAAKLLEALSHELDTFGKSLVAGLDGLRSPLVSSRVTSNPLFRGNAADEVVHGVPHQGQQGHSA